MFLLAFISVGDTCTYTDKYGMVHSCHAFKVGGISVPYESLESSLETFTLLSSSLDIHAYSYYYASILMRKIGVPAEYRFILFLLASVGWELFETYGWRTTPVSVTDMVANALGFTVGELGGDRLSLTLGLQPMREYPEDWILRGEVDDGSPAYMFLGRFNTNYSPRTLYLRINLGRLTARIGYNLGASYGKVYMYYHPYDTTGIPSLYLSPDFPPIHVGRVPLPPVATECGFDSIWCFWSASGFLQVLFRY